MDREAQVLIMDILHFEEVFTSLNAIRYDTYRDKLERGLSKKGIYVIQLQGHIFFGNIQQVSSHFFVII